MPNRKLAKSIFEEFKAKPESGFIASEFAILNLANFLSANAIKSVLEVGAGIGTITKLLLSHPARPADVTSTEEVPVCLRELEKNLAGTDKRGWRLVNGITEIGKDQAFDLVIFDGILDPQYQYDFFQKGTWCFVEGNRRDTRLELVNHLEKSGLTISMTSFFPGGHKIRITPGRKLFGLRLPRIQLKRRKGCHIGQVVALQT
jgi:protein-L-isoaspartate O-methyltransferase